MSEHQDGNHDVRYEKEDINERSTFWFGFWILALMVGVSFLLKPLYNFLVARGDDSQAPAAYVAEADPDALVPPGPRLQARPEIELAAFRAQEDAHPRVVCLGREGPGHRPHPDRRGGADRRRAGSADLPGFQRRAGAGGRGVAMRRSLLAGLALLALPALATAQLGPKPPPMAVGQPEILKEIGWDQKLGEKIPLDLAFKDETGKDVVLGDYFGDKPVVLSLVYYECPMLCTISLNGLARALEVLSFVPGQEFEVLTVSFDANEGTRLAAAKKNAYMASYEKKEEGAQGWHFLTGDQEAVDRLTRATGFRFAWDEETEQFAHPAGILVAAPDGTISHYLFGVEYCAPGPAPGAGGCRRGPGRQRRRPGVPLLLPVRPRDGSLQCGHLQHRPDRGARHPPRHGRPDPHHFHAAPREDERAASRSRATEAMNQAFPLMPEQASAQAGEVDALFFFIVAVTVFFTIGDLGGGRLLRHQVPSPLRRRPCRRRSTARSGSR